MTPRLPHRYKILHALGHGGQGSVWLAIDQLDGGAPVAVKVLHGHESADRFAPLAAEFLILAKLSHPCIVRVRGFGALDGESGAYLASDYVEGPDLLAWAAQTDPATVCEALLDVAAQLLSVLHYLELRGLEHGDVKPANVLVEHEAGPGETRAVPRLIDFGLARLASAGATAEGGTRAYAVPPGLEAAGPRRDLYALGLSLFHAAAGRLPFPLGDAEAACAWKASGRAAELGAPAPPALGELVAGLTGWRDRGGLRSAREALDWLKGRIPLRRLPRPRLAEQTWFPCREAFVERLSAAVEAGGVHAIAAPPGAGKSRTLGMLALHLQARGWRVVLGRGPQDPALAAAIEDLDLAGGARRTRERLAVLVDDVTSGGAELPFLVRAAAAAAAGERGSRRLTAFVGACQSPPELAVGLGMLPRALQVHVLEKLSEDSAAAALRQAFGVDEAPEDVVAVLARESDGMPLRLHAAIDALRAHGAGADFLGHLLVKRPLPERLLASPPGDEARALHLAVPLRRTLGVLAAAAVPLTPAEAMLLEGGAADGDCQARLEELCWRGWARSESAGESARYRLLGRDNAQGLASTVLGDEEAAVRARLADFHAERWRAPPASIATLAAAGANALARGDLRTASRAASRACRSARGDDPGEEPARLCAEVSRAIDAALGGAGAHRTRERGRSSRRGVDVLRLRAAADLIRRGRWRQAIEVLPPPPPPSTLLARVRWRLEGAAHEQAGDATLAAAAFESARRASCEAGRNGVEELLATASLTPLFFRLGRSADGERGLAQGRAWLDKAAGRSPGPGDGGGVLLSRTLALLATAEAVHGDASHARRFLAAAIESARRIGREDLLVKPLNELGITHGERQRWDDAERAFSELEALARRRGDRLDALRAVYNRAVLRYRRRDLEPAERLFRQARELSDSLGAHALAATVWLGLAGVLRERGSVVEAVRLYRRVLRAPALARLNDRALAHNNLSEAYLALGSLRRALGHAFSARRLAMRAGNRFLDGATLRARGLARLVAGDAQGAGRDLERGRALAMGAGDVRAQAEADLYSGFLEAFSGRLDAALRSFRRASVAARTAVDSKRRRDATLAIHLGLVARGRTRAARRWLARLGDAPRAAVVSLLSAAIEPPSVARAERLLAAARHGAETGEAPGVFFALAWEALRGEPDLRTELSGWLFKLARRLGDRRQSQLRAFWLPASSGSRVAAAAAPAAGPGSYPMLYRALSRGDSPDEILAGILADLRGSLGAAAAWILLDPAHDSRAALVDPPDAPAEAAVAHSQRLVARAASGERVLADPPVLACPLPHPRLRRALGIDLGSCQLPRPRVEAALVQASAWAALALALKEQEREARESLAARDGAQVEMRRRNAAAAQGHRELETAGIERRAEVKVAAGDGSGVERAARPSQQVSVAASPAMRAVLARLPRLARLDMPILIVGESGVGKDWLARRIHELSPRAARPFLAEVCSIPESLVEAELFGHREGAFTDATRSRPGVFERVAGGTIYLDEIGGLSPGMQVRLLRVLEEKQVRPLGGETALSVDFRLISSSSTPLDELQRAPGFRRELLYRVQGEVIVVPPLRDRPEDVPVLVEALLRAQARRRGKPVPYIHPNALRLLCEHSWPGNVRELVNELERMLVDDPVEVTPGMIQVREKASARAPGASWSAVGPLLPLREARRRLERDLVERTLRECEGNALRAARMLKVTRRHLTTLLAKHKLKLEPFRPPSPPDASPPARKRSPARRGGKRRRQE